MGAIADSAGEGMDGRGQHRVLVRGDANALPEGCCVLAIISKAPQAGKVKTRLVPPLTAEQAAELHAAFLKDMSATIAACALGCRPSAASDPSSQACQGVVQGGVVYTPVGAESAFDGLLPEEFALLAQGEGDLGDRLAQAVGELLAMGASAVCLLNSDSPTLPSAILEEAVRRLGAAGDRVVLGPAEDGGYYLIGLKRQHRELFERIDWSTDAVLGQTLERAAEIGLAAELLPSWFDVDDEKDLARLMSGVQAGAAHASSAASSRAVLRGIFPDGLPSGQGGANSTQIGAG